MSYQKGFLNYFTSLLYFSVTTAPLLGTPIQVTVLSDAIPAPINSLRAATNTANAPSSSQIQFSLSGTITLADAMQPFGLQPVSDASKTLNVSVDLNGNSVTIAGGGINGGLFIFPYTTFTLTDTSPSPGRLILQETSSIGGDGGGGGLGAGGGIVVMDHATATLSYVTFTGCQAQGGSGTEAGDTGGGGLCGAHGGENPTHEIYYGAGGGGGFGVHGYGGDANGDGSGGSGGGGGGGIFFHGGSTPFSSSAVGGGGGGGNSGNGANGTGSGGGAGGSGSSGNAGGAGGAISSSPGGTDAESGMGGGGGAAPSGAGGGGGGLGGGGSASSGGGGGGIGGSGGGAGLSSTDGGAGGFGGGGGSSDAGRGGTGGFGGGGGSGTTAVGAGGFGAGAGTVDRGGGGAALGGVIFIDQYATLELVGHIGSLEGSVTGGSGGHSGQALGRDIFIVSSGTLNFNIDSDLTIGSAIESNLAVGGRGALGSGGVKMSGSGKLTLTGDNSYTGSTFMNGGTVAISADTNLGYSSNVLSFNGGTLELLSSLDSARGITLNSSGGGLQTNTGTSTFSANIHGTGSFTKTGSGSLLLTGSCDYTGATAVNEGALIMNGTLLASTVTVGSLGVLQGTGTIGTALINGTVAPGNSIGTLYVEDMTFNPGSNYECELNNNQSDVITASGVVSIGPNVTLTLAPVDLSKPLASYTVLTAEGGLESSLDGQEASTLGLGLRGFTLVNPTRYLFDLQYTSREVFLLWKGYKGYIAVGNAGKVAACFSDISTQSIEQLQTFIDILNAQTEAQWQTTFEQMHPANFNNIAFGEENVAERIRHTFTDHLYETQMTECSQKPWDVWVTPFGEWSHQQGHQQLTGYHQNFGGFTLGSDYHLNSSWVFTGGFSLANSHITLERGSSDFMTYGGSVGSMWSEEGWFAGGLFSYLYNAIDASRKMYFGVETETVSRTLTLKASHTQASNEVMGHLGGGYDLLWKVAQGNLHLYPFLNLDYIYVQQNGYREAGAGALDLRVDGKAYDLFRPELGIGFDYMRCFPTYRISVDTSMSYVSEVRFLGKETTAHFVGNSCQFTVKGLKPLNQLFSPMIRLGFGTASGSWMALLGYHGDYGKKFQESSIELEVRSAF